MTPALPLLSGDTLVVSPSQLETIKTCARHWQFRYLYRRVENRPHAARDAGSAFDKAMTMRYKRLGSAPVLPDSELETELNATIDAGFAGLDLPLEEYRTAALYKQVLAAYNKQWGRENFEVLAVQLPFAVELGYITPSPMFWGRVDQPDVMATYKKRVRVILQGILDLLVRLPDGKIATVDCKTQKDWGDNKVIEWENSSQMKAYCWGMTELSRLHPELGLPAGVSTAIVNAVIIRPPYKNPDRKPGARDKERIEFRRPSVTYTPERLDEWRADTLAWIGMALGWVANDHFPQNEKSCANHYGKACPYLGVCTFPPAQREMILASDEYKEYARSPLAAPDLKAV